MRTIQYPKIGRHTSRTWQAANKVGIDLRRDYDVIRPEQEESDVE